MRGRRVAIGAAVVVALALVLGTLDAAPRGIAIGGVIASALVAVLFPRRAFGARASACAAIAAVSTAGQTQLGAPYAIASALFVVTTLASLRRARATGSVPRPRRRALVAFVVTASAIAGALLATLPPVAALVERRMTALFSSYRSDEETAFSTRMKLGATKGMLQSNTVVMHVAGSSSPYLRGAVYDEFDWQSRWTTSLRGRATTIVPSRTEGARDAAVVLVRGTPDGADMRWFLPADACDLLTTNPSVEIDAFGVARRAKVDEPATLRFRTGCVAAIAPPGPNDVDIERSVRPQLRAIGDAWIAGAEPAEAKLAAITRELAKFEYSLEVARDPMVDPIIDFLTLHRAGHCEFFASALVLLARAQGIPARVVGGYHVGAVNPLTGLAVVRERNAHAWAEVWYGDAWHRLDPTPRSELPLARPGLLENLGDAASLAWAAVRTFLERLGPLGIVAIGVVAIALWFGVRVALDRVLRHRRVRRMPPGERPLPCYERLSIALASAGVSRGDAETLEAFALRVAARSEPWAADVATAVTSYAALRYGGVGDESAVTATLERVAARVH